MAMVQCPECGREVSDQAATCPNCGCPLGVTSVAPAKREKAASLRGGAIIGLVGGLSFIAVLAVLAIGTMQSTKEPTYTLAPASEGVYGIRMRPRSWRSSPQRPSSPSPWRSASDSRGRPQ